MGDEICGLSGQHPKKALQIIFVYLHCWMGNSSWFCYSGVEMGGIFINVVIKILQSLV